MRDHQPVVIDEFNGLWRRGDVDAVPMDHFSDVNNIRFGHGNFKTRGGIDSYLPYANVVRIYTFTQESGQSLLVLDNMGNIYDNGSPSPFVPILTVEGMTDFDMVSIGGRAYITPTDGRTGLEDEFIYVYLGDGSPARKAAGFGPNDGEGALSASNSGSSGNVEAGVRIFGVVYETNTGFLTNIGPDTLAVVTAPGGESVDLSSIPVSPNSYVVNVHVVATKAIPASFYTGNTRGYTFYRVPGAVVANGVTTLTVSFFDNELLDDWSHLQDLFEEIPAGVGLTSYHGRMVSWAEFDNISLIRASVAGEPEAFNQIDGLMIFPLDGYPITRVQEFRDVLYAFKRTRTNAFNDNGEEPSAWPMTVLDQGIGSALHGVAAVLDSGGVNVDFLVIIDFNGVMLFNGSYIRPELTFKIQDYWLGLNRDEFNKIQVLNDSLNQIIYITLPDNSGMLVGDYSNGLDHKAIKWTIWTFHFNITCVTLIETSTLILGSSGAL